MTRAGNRSGSNDVLRRSVVLPRDLFLDVERAARADRFASVQTWAVCALQRLVNERPELQPPNGR